MTRLILAAPLLLMGLLTTPMARQSGECNIKGNVNTRGERIYDIPGQKYYDETRISPAHGERWFCPEAKARAAG
jgi:hypothetical protein